MNPYPGLRAFEAEEDHLFFGREKEVDELLRRLRSTRFLAVVGTSGSGKSSLVRCGLISSLYGGFMAKAGSSWRVTKFRPGEDPTYDISLEAKPGVLSVKVRLVRGARPADVRNCRARLVDPARQRILAQAPLEPWGDDAMALLEIPDLPGREPGRWVEIVERPDVPVRDARWRTLQGTWRWGLSALRAERLGQGPFAARRWASCGSDWEAVRDTERAFLARYRAAALDSSRETPTSPGTDWADALAQLAIQREEPFLAETLRW